MKKFIEEDKLRERKNLPESSNKIELMANVNDEYKKIIEYDMSQIWPEMTHLRKKWAFILSTDAHRHSDICNKLFDVGYFIIRTYDFIEEKEVLIIDANNKDLHLKTLEVILEHQKVSPKDLLLYIDNPGGIVLKGIQEIIDFAKDDFIIMYSQLPIDHPEYLLGYIIQNKGE